MHTDGDKPTTSTPESRQQLRVEIIRTAAATLRDAAAILETAAQALEESQ